MGCSLCQLSFDNLPHWFVAGMAGFFCAEYQHLDMLQKFAGFVADPIIRQGPLDPQTAHRIPSDSNPEEIHGIRRLIREDRHVGHP